MATISTTAPPESAAAAASPPQARAAHERVIALDIFRGATIAGMIVVNDPGTWSAMYWPLAHAEWNGWTPTDLIFPFFLFIMGVAMVYSFRARLERGAQRSTLMLHVLRRSAIIFAIGFFLAAFPRFHLSTVRIPGVLARIAVVYLFTGAAYLYLGRRARIAAVVVILLGYWAAMTLIPVPGYGAGNLTPDGALSAFIDRKLLYEHLWVKHRWDPEGLLSSFPAICTALLGVFAGEWLTGARSRMQKLAGMFGAGVVLLIAGRVWGLWFPINKNLWTSSYVVFTAGFALVLLGICYWLTEMKGWRAWGQPFVWLGTNAILVFALSGFVAKCSVIFKFNAGGRLVTGHQWVYDRLFAPFGRPVNASLAFALAFLAIFWLLAAAMYRKKIFVKI
jgi:predicted acyltransferase